MEPRVASILASFSGSVSEAPGCPVSSLLQLRLPMSLRVSPNPASSDLAGDGASSCLDSRILQRLCVRGSRFPRLLASPAPPPTKASGCPASSIFRLAYGESSGCPESSPSGLALGSTSGLPRLPRLLACLGISLWVAPNPSPLASPTGGSPGCPELRTLRRRRLRILGSPRLLRLRLCRSTSPGFPESCFCGWADVDSPAQLELCILDARPRMNLRVQSGLAHSCPALDALLNLIRPSTAVAGRGVPFSIHPAWQDDAELIEFGSPLTGNGAWKARRRLRMHPGSGGNVQAPIEVEDSSAALPRMQSSTEAGELSSTLPCTPVSG